MTLKAKILKIKQVHSIADSESLLIRQYKEMLVVSPTSRDD